MGSPRPANLSHSLLSPFTGCVSPRSGSASCPLCDCSPLLESLAGCVGLGREPRKHGSNETGVAAPGSRSSRAPSLRPRVETAGEGASSPARSPAQLPEKTGSSLSVGQRGSPPPNSTLPCSNELCTQPLGHGPEAVVTWPHSGLRYGMWCNQTAQRFLLHIHSPLREWFPSEQLTDQCH